MDITVTSKTDLDISVHSVSLACIVWEDSSRWIRLLICTPAVPLQIRTASISCNHLALMDYTRLFLAVTRCAVVQQQRRRRRIDIFGQPTRMYRCARIVVDLVKTSVLSVHHFHSSLSVFINILVHLPVHCT